MNIFGAKAIRNLNMCEWLSHGDWCDVKLLCGGRSFNAHRAVLASVSTFLRRILLSSPSDESPTFIVLPDFDLEAMSSVLYYIYNGEVTLQKHKLGLFLDIIQAMQIYIDCQYLPKIREVVEEDNFDLNMFHEANSVKNIFTLGFGDDNDQKYFNLRRGTQMRSVLLQYSQGKADFHDNTVRCQNGSELRKSRLGNLKSPYGDRQRNSFLRDLFIETYPRNGNVNGLTEGVLAISNECYHSPASMLSPNANGGHLGGDALSRFHTKTSEQSLSMSAIFHDNREIHSGNSFNGRCKIQQNNIVGPIKFPEDASAMTFVYGNRETNTSVKNDRTSLLPRQFNDISLWPGLNASLDLRRTILGAMQYCVMDDSSHSGLQNSSSRCENGEKIKDLKINRSPKIIFNQVLENPWSPRIPKNFKPFRRKLEHIVQNHKVETIGAMNDNNNNIRKSKLEVEENILPSLETTKSISPICTKLVDSFKCTHCNQVFTTDESLALHSRRHSTNARYSCGECGKTFSQLRNFKYHMSIHRGTREFAATCTVCGKYFNDRGYLSSHMKIHRNRKEYKCTQCPKSFNQRVAYNMHVRIHTGVKPHVCEECGKAFSRKMLLKQHQRTHSGERPYACTHCDKRFADRSNMTLHLRLHTGVKPFSCSLCPKSFTKKHHLKSHLNFHTGSKPYSCPRCNLAFTQSSNMRTHYKKCSAPEPVEVTDGSGNDSQTHS